MLARVLWRLKVHILDKCIHYAIMGTGNLQLHIAQTTTHEKENMPMAHLFVQNKEKIKSSALVMLIQRRKNKLFTMAGIEYKVIGTIANEEGVWLIKGTSPTILVDGTTKVVTKRMTENDIIDAIQKFDSLPVLARKGTTRVLIPKPPRQINLTSCSHY